MLHLEKLRGWRDICQWHEILIYCWLVWLLYPILQ
jgi:hypothetical protein